MHKEIAAVFLVVAIVFCCPQPSCFGEDAPRAEVGQRLAAGAQGPTIFTRATPLSHQEMARYAQFQEAANQNHLLDAPGAVSGGDVAFMYIVMGLLIAGSVIATVAMFAG